MYISERYTKAKETIEHLIDERRCSDNDIFHNIIQLKEIFDNIYILLEFDYMFPDKAEKSRRDDFKKAFDLIYHDVRSQIISLCYWAEKFPDEYDSVLSKMAHKTQWLFVFNKLFELCVDFIEGRQFTVAYNFYGGSCPMGTINRPIRLRIVKKAPDGKIKWWLTKNDLASFGERLKQQAKESEFYRVRMQDIYNGAVEASFITDSDDIYKEYEDFIYNRNKK